MCGIHFGTSHYALGAFCAVSLVACSHSSNEQGASATSAEVRPQSQAQPARASCDPRRELITCDFPAVQNLAAGACDYLRQQLAGRQVADETIVSVVDCDAPVMAQGSGAGTAAAVAARLSVDGPPSHGAFLFARVGDGWRLVDQLLDPAWTHGGQCNVRFRLEWKPGEGSASDTVDAMSERVCHMPLDQQELAAGESDVASRECQHARYGFTNNKVTRLSREGSDSTCDFE